jgi:hypothetical protein
MCRLELFYVVYVALPAAGLIELKQFDFDQL